MSDKRKDHTYVTSHELEAVHSTSSHSTLDKMQSHGQTLLQWWLRDVVFIWEGCPATKMKKTLMGILKEKMENGFQRMESHLECGQVAEYLTTYRHD